MTYCYENSRGAIIFRFLSFKFALFNPHLWFPLWAMIFSLEFVGVYYFLARLMLETGNRFSSNSSENLSEYIDVIYHYYFTVA